MKVLGIFLRLVSLPIWVVLFSIWIVEMIAVVCSVFLIGFILDWVLQMEYEYPGHATFRLMSEFDKLLKKF